MGNWHKNKEIELEETGKRDETFKITLLFGQQCGRKFAGYFQRINLSVREEIKPSKAYPELL